MTESLNPPRYLLLVRGLPGSGKSTIAAKFAAAVFAADDFFMCDNVYRFDPTKLATAHEVCQYKTREAIRSGLVVTAVANTFTCRWEMQPYIDMANEEGVSLIVIDLFDAGLDDAALAARNLHGVPVHAIASMRARYEHGWRSADPRVPWARPQPADNAGGA